jgi:imidazole glycerol-phosphate synthase subunit HisH
VSGRVVIIDYGSGNLRSAAKAFERAAHESGFAGTVAVTAQPDDVAGASHIVLPGVGAFADCMNGLRALPGMVDALTQAVRREGKPFLGICVGMQLLASRGLEHGVHEGLGWLSGDVKRLEPADASLKIPHMGWNELVVKQAHPLFAGIETGAHAYFVHSYHFVPADPDVVGLSTDYGGALTAAVVRGNIAGTQFHPEKSQEAGLRLIANFLHWQPESDVRPEQDGE